MKTIKGLNKQRLAKIGLYMLADIVIILASILIGLSVFWQMGFPGSHTLAIPPSAWIWFRHISIAASCICVVVYTFFHMYNNLWKYASMDEVIKIFLATTIVFLLIYAFDYFILSPLNLLTISKRMYFISWLFACVMVTFSRFGYRLVKRIFIAAGHVISSKSGCSRVLVVGAGFSGYGVIRGMQNAKVRNQLPVLVVDPDPTKNNTNILGIRVLEGIHRIPELVEQYEIDEIIIALPSANPIELKEAVEYSTKTDCKLKIMPPMSDVDETYNGLREVNIADLLYREEVTLDTKNISDYLKNRVILLTGGSGSIGSELCRQIIKFMPASIIIFDIYENTAYELVNELKGTSDIPIYLRIGSIQDVKRLEAVFNEFKPNVVFHTAAHKHVPIMEENKAEAVKNNVFGTLNVSKCADKFSAERFVLISTDKAVNPSNAYGATKRIAELIVQNLMRESKTKFITVRFGNVLGSNGSVLSIFKHQIAKGGPVTVTHPEVVRYFMTIPEAAQLVLQAVSMGQDGKIFVLDMSTPIKIDDMARKLIRLAGLKPDEDIKIEYTGLRPGDKLFEELVLDEEQDSLKVSCHKKILIAKPRDIDINLFKKQLKDLETAAAADSGVDDVLHEMVPNYVNKFGEKNV